VFFTDNAARGRNVGVEFSGARRFGDAVSADLSLGLLDTNIEQCRCGTRDLSDRAQANAPRTTGALGVDFDAGNGWFARIETTHRAGYFFSDSHDERARAATLVNARIGYTSERFSLSLWARNLSNTRHEIRGFFFGNEPPDFPNKLYVQRGDPRFFGLTLELTP
jgi:iron complex outermembrane recepter protein